MKEVVFAPVCHEQWETLEAIEETVFAKTIPEEWWHVVIPYEKPKKQAKEFAAMLSLTISQDTDWNFIPYSWSLPNDLDSKNPAYLIFAGYPVFFAGSMGWMMIRVEGEVTTLRMGNSPDHKNRWPDIQAIFTIGSTMYNCSLLSMEGYIIFPKRSIDLLKKADNFRIHH